jgi:hypothetical protein
MVRLRIFQLYDGAKIHHHSEETALKFAFPRQCVPPYSLMWCWAARSCGSCVASDYEGQSPCSMVVSVASTFETQAFTNYTSDYKKDLVLDDVA